MKGSRFYIIDPKLKAFGKTFNRAVSDGQELSTAYSQVPEQRRISWMDGDISKIIMIIPTRFPPENLGNDSVTWDFWLMAWLENAPGTEKPMWEKTLVFQGEFQLIVDHIDDLLKRAEATLSKVQKKDLRTTFVGSMPKPGLQPD